MPLRPHPYAKLHHYAAIMLESLVQELRELEKKIRALEREEEELYGKLAWEYGLGRPYTKCVGGKVYVYWDVYNGNDVRLEGKDAEKALRLLRVRSELRELRKTYKAKRKMYRRYRAHYMATAPYAGVCLESNRSVPCPPQVLEQLIESLQAKMGQK